MTISSCRPRDSIDEDENSRSILIYRRFIFSTINSIVGLGRGSFVDAYSRDSGQRDPTLLDTMTMLRQEYEKHLGNEPAEAWICHAENLWAENCPFRHPKDPKETKSHKEANEPKDLDEHTLRLQAARKAKIDLWLKAGEEAEEEFLALFEMSDLLWRILVRRYAVRAQLIDIM